MSTTKPYFRSMTFPEDAVPFTLSVLQRVAAERGGGDRVIMENLIRMFAAGTGFGGQSAKNDPQTD